MKILAAVVTYNRGPLLDRCLNHLILQSYKADEILVVNNGSTDNTEKILIENRVKFISQENLGSAGGWHSGIQFAIDEGFDYVWLMDDDGYPDKNALNELIKYDDKEISCISSIVVREDEPSKLVFGYPEIDHSGNPKILSFLKKNL